MAQWPAGDHVRYFVINFCKELKEPNFLYMYMSFRHYQAILKGFGDLMSNVRFMLSLREDLDLVIR